MKIPAIPKNDAKRVQALESYNILDTQAEEIFDNITWIAALVCNTPISLISLIDGDRQFLKSVQGEMSKADSPRKNAFCAHVINQEGLMEVQDALKDERFHDNPFVTAEPSIRFYAGVPLVNSDNYKLGTLCVIDKSPKALTTLQKDVLNRLSKIVIALFEARKLAFNQIKESVNSELILRDAKEKVETSLQEMQKRHLEMSCLTELTGILQACQSQEEVQHTLTTYCKKLFGDAKGALYLIEDQDHFLKPAVVWGMEASRKQSFNVNECWSMRRGHIYQVENSKTDLCCRHFSQEEDKPPFSTLCVPLIAQGESIGLLAMEFINEANSRLIEENRILLAIAISEQTALALANIKLRNKLHQQSNSDPLTGLSNRRCLQSEFSVLKKAADLNNKPISIVLFDVDNFKKINDTLGHDGGDSVLQKISDLMRQYSRKDDIVCRLGGDEMLIVFPDLSLDSAAERAEQIKNAAHKLQIGVGNQLSNTITISMGVVVYPQHGHTLEKLLLEADKVLYQAKKSGRDCAIVKKD